MPERQIKARFLAGDRGVVAEGTVSVGTPGYTREETGLGTVTRSVAKLKIAGIAARRGRVTSVAVVAGDEMLCRFDLDPTAPPVEVGTPLAAEVLMPWGTWEIFCEIAKSA